MDAVKLNFNSPNFGAVHKSAVKKAIQLANGDLGELRAVEKIIKKQKDNNVYDIDGLLKPGEYYNYLVVKRGENSGQAFKKLSDASDYATNMRNYDAQNEMEVAQKLKSKPEFDVFASKLLDICEE